MEQPFVWPALPENRKPWGIGEFKTELHGNVVRSESVDNVEIRRERAKSLREQVKALLMKKDTSKAKSGEEKEKLSTLELWEKKRTFKVVEGDEGSDYVIKV
jgi:large subunit ribosomal protein L23